MRPPRFRLRTLLIAVAVAAVGFGLERRRAGLLTLASWHARQEERYSLLCLETTKRHKLAPLTRRLAYHRDRRRAFDRAARRPWLPVEPAPSEPE